jgi:Copper amine oxidase N-terminal domain.
MNKKWGLKMKRFQRLSIIIAFSLLAAVFAQGLFVREIYQKDNKVLAYSEQKVIVKLDGKVVSFPDTQPYVNEDNRTMVPVRFISEAMGCEVKWEEANQMVIITKAPKRILLQIDQNWAIVNDTKTDMRKEFDTKAVLKNDRTMVPLRFVSETLGAGVAWDEGNSTVVIRSDGVVEQVAGTTPTPTPTPTKFPDIVHTETPKPVVYSTPPPNPWKNVEEPMTLIEAESDTMPEGFIQPEFTVKHLADGLASYFNIKLSNLADYKDTASDYAFKITCLNYDIVNWRTSIPDIERTDNLRNLSDKFLYQYLNPILWASPSSTQQFKSHPELGSLEMKEGLTLDMQVEFYYAGLKHVYRSSVTVHDK